jgi:hypothetical protein
VRTTYGTAGLVPHGGRSFERLFFVREHRRNTHGCKQFRHETTSLNLRLTRAQGWVGINILLRIDDVDSGSPGGEACKCGVIHTSTVLGAIPNGPAATCPCLVRIVVGWMR